METADMTFSDPAVDEAARHYAKLRRVVLDARPRGPLGAAVVHPVEAASLQGALAAAEVGLIDPLLVGPRPRIEAAAEALEADISKLRLEDVPHSHAAAERAVELARDGTVGALMKGALHTDELMQPVTQARSGLRTERRLSHVFALDVPDYARLLFITDAAVNIAPDLEEKADIVQNAVDLARALGIAQPKVAILSAVETVSSKFQSTIDAAALCKMAERGQIVGGELDGPLAFDNAIDAEAARTKGIDSPVAGQAQVLVVPDIEAGNMLAKQLEYMAHAEAAGVVLGARVPVVLTSRADDVMARVASCALAVSYAAWRTGPQPSREAG
jgi:phosphotransacetylase